MLTSVQPKTEAKKDVSSTAKAVSTVTIVTVISVTAACVAAVFFMAALVLWRYQILPLQKNKPTNFNVLLESNEGGEKT